MDNQDRHIEAAQLIKRRLHADSLKSNLEATIEHRLNRYYEIDHQGIIGNHYFASASSECIYLYRDGYFISAVMLSQAVNEAIIRFVAERKGIEGENHSELMKNLQNRGIISSQCADAVERIWGSFRNDVHHMNPKVASIPFDELAKRNLQDLSIVETEVFGTDFKDGGLVPHHPEYWDISEGGTVPAFLRLE